MGPKSNFRPRGGAVRGGRGRGRGRGKPQNIGRRPRFDSTRTATVEEQDELGTRKAEDSSSGEDDQEALAESGSEAEEGDGEASVRPYLALMKSFTDNPVNKAKRRKLAHTESRAEPSDVPDVASTEDESHEVDRADDVDEEPDEGSADDISDDEDQVDTSDPFETHFAEPNESEIGTRIKALQSNAWTSTKSATAKSRTVFTQPRVGADGDGKALPSVLASGPSDLTLKHKLQESMSTLRPEFDGLEQRVAPLLFQYYDTLFCGRDVESAEILRRLACLHAVNHVFKTRDRVIKNNAKVTREAASAELELRDQGFTRPKVLMLLPTRQACAKVVEMICAICRPEQQENRKRFDDSYLDKEVKFGDDKPADFCDLFEGNDDDMFRLGLKFTRKTLKYFSQFYNSDIILASPLGLRMAMGSEEDKKAKKLDFDFLSSIEIVIVDHADALLMQNWEHVEHIFEHLNRQPKDARGVDFSRVRNWYLDDQAKYFRQTVIFTAFNTPELSELARTSCHNWAGMVRVQPEYPGVIGQLGVRAKQTFSRFDVLSVDKDPDARFAYFTKAIVPSLLKRAKDSSGTLVFIPSYLDFVRVRNFFASSPAVANLSFGTISEYADVPEASRARSHFVTGRHKVLLYTERAHHFRRYQLKGVQRVVMYGLPDNPLFYKELTGGYLSRSEQDLKLEPGQGSVRVLFSKYDVLKLERIAGSQRLGKMIRDRSDTFVFEEEKAK